MDVWEIVYETHSSPCLDTVAWSSLAFSSLLVPSSPMWQRKIQKKVFLQKRFEKNKIILFTLNCQLPKHLTDKQETNQRIADLNNCTLARRRQVLPLHHWACAGITENTICILQIYKKANGNKTVLKQLNDLKFPWAGSNLGPHKKEHELFRTDAHSECTQQRNRYFISELWARGKW